MLRVNCFFGGEGRLKRGILMVEAEYQFDGQGVKRHWGRVGKESPVGRKLLVESRE